METQIEFPLELDRPLPLLPILAIDPGETSGYVKLARAGTSLSLTYGNFKWPDGVLDLDRLLAHSSTVIVERFNLFPGKAKVQTGSNFPAVEVIGYIRGQLQKREQAHHLFFVAPSQSAVWKTEEIMRLVKGRHVKSALGVLMHFIVNRSKK